jgi:hypothetical protein
MRKYVFMSLLALVLVGFSSCVVKESPECKFHAKSVYLTVYSNEWKYDKDLMQFYAHFDMPELTTDVYNYGNYSLHRVYNVQQKDEYQVALPQTVYLIENVVDAEGTVSEYYYSQQVDYRVGVGYVEIQVTNSDYFYSEDSQGYLINPETMDFHLQLIW